jgi:hypothetical protein
MHRIDLKDFIGTVRITTGTVNRGIGHSPDGSDAQDFYPPTFDVVGLPRYLFSDYPFTVIGERITESEAL